MVGGGSLLGFVVSENLHRRHLTESQREAIAVEILPRLENEAKERQRQHGGTAPGRGKTLGEQVPQVKGKATERAGELLGVSYRYDADAKAVKDADPRLFQDVKDGKVSVKKAKRAVRQRELEAMKFSPKTEGTSVFDTTYQVILADPPWPYDNKIDRWGPADFHYPSMSMDKILSLPEDLDLKIDENAVLFLWVTNPFVHEGLVVCERWGFAYKTNLAVRGRHELLSLAVRGSFTPPENLAPPVGTVIEAEVREHSQKPLEQYEIIERLYPNCNRLELFARAPRKAWNSCGEELRN